MSKEQSGIEINGYILVNTEKYNRVIYGIPGPKGELINALGEDAPPELVLAHYDKHMGLIKTKDGRKLEHGCFWDFKKKKPKEQVVEVKSEEKREIEGLKVNVQEVGNKKDRKSKKIEEE